MTPRAIVAAVPDPELPVVTIEELGILRDVEQQPDGRVVVTITPTYSGCPAIEAIREAIAGRLAAAGHAAEVRTVLSPAWTTDWISESGRRKLAEAGIAPPGPADAPLLSLGVCCPRCGSFDTREVSRFGSTACKAHHVCQACAEPFDRMKAI